MTPSDNSKACPFCGKDESLTLKGYMNAVDEQAFCVSCDTCRYDGPNGPTAGLATKYWNTRAPDPMVVELKRVSKFADSLKVKPDKYDYGEGMNATCITIKAFVDSIISRLGPETKGGQDGRQ